MSERSYRFLQVDVFTDRVFGGNPLAVFPDGSGISDAEMQDIGREMNLSETTFVLPPTREGCIAQVRIFTPQSELPFAGHPTIGTAYVLATEGRVEASMREIVLDERVGPVPVRLEGDIASPSFLWMQHPAATFGPEISQRRALAAALGLQEDDLLHDAPIQVGSTGMPFLYIPLRDPARVDRAVLDVPALLACFNDPSVRGVFVFGPDTRGEPGRVYSRMFGPHTVGIPEDPATGSASGALGAYLVQHRLVPDSEEVRIVSEQGNKMGRQSLIHIRLTRRADHPQAPLIEVGGSVVPVLTGVLRLP